MGLEKTAAGFDHIGFRPGKVNAIAAGLGEAGGGALLAVGIGSPGAGAAIAGTMIVASSMHIDNGFFLVQRRFGFHRHRPAAPRRRQYSRGRRHSG
jgi:uncharacterized membrane protein YphA (DoxX/SURF4 family)